MASGIEGRGTRPATLLFCVAAAGSALLLLALGSRLTFLLDDWEILIYRPGFTAHAILGPHGENIAIGPVLVYKALLATAGMDSALPFRVVSVAAFIASVSVLFVWLRRRVGEWTALAVAVAILFLGAAWEDLLWPFQVGYFVSMGAGLGALLALERRDSLGDLIACGLLILSVVFSSLGLPFLAAGAVAIALGPRRGWAGRAFVIVVPSALFAIWWLGWGHVADAEISLENIATAPIFLIDGLASSISSLVGLATPRDESAVTALDWGRPLLVVAVGLAAWRLWRLRRIDTGLIVVLALTAAFWLLIGINEKPGRDPLASRYQYVGAIFVVLIAAELLKGTRLRPRWLLVLFAVTGLAVFSNLSFLHQRYAILKGVSEIERADLAAVEIARDSVDPSFRLDEDIALTAYVGVAAGPYLSARDAFGSPAYDEAELAAAPVPARAAADSVLAAALEMSASPGGVPLPGSCITVEAGGSDQPGVVDLPPGGAVVEAPDDSAIELELRRFADEFGISGGAVPAAGTRTLEIPADRSSRPWQLALSGRGEVAVCGIRTVGSGG